MKTKSDVQRNLLKEVDEISRQHNLHYVMVGLNSLNAFRNHTISNGPRITAVAMTQGDIDRFCEIVENECPDRYIEGMFNNPKYLGYHFSYGDRNTTDFHVINRDDMIHHGINIRIYPIRVPIPDSKAKFLDKEHQIRKFLSKKIENKRFWYIRWGISALNGAYAITGGGKRYYRQIRKLTFIDKWEDIQQLGKVDVGNKTIPTKFFRDVERIDVDGLDACLPTRLNEYFVEIYGINVDRKVIKPATQRLRDIVDTEYGYDEIMPETEELSRKARALHEELIWERKRFQDERETIDHLWFLARMTNKQIEYINFFDERYDELSKYDLDDPKEFKELYKNIKPVIGSLKRYAKYGMTYSISPQADKLIEDVLVKNGEGKFARELKEISKKEYFVE